MRLWLVLSLLLPVGALPGALPPQMAPSPATPLATEPNGLLQFFQKRTLGPDQQKRLRDLIQKLGAKDYITREKAMSLLMKEGTAARPLLLQALADPDEEIVRRAQVCLRSFDLAGERAQVKTAARLLVHDRFPQAAEVLLAYLPFAADESMHEALGEALVALSKSTGRVDPCMLQALADPLPLKRMVVGEALCAIDAKKHKPQVLPLLRDPDPQVRLRLALALVDHRQKEGVPTLIALITKLPESEVWRVEEALCRLAGDDAPPQVVGGKTAVAEVHDAWAAWWKKTERVLEFSKEELTPKTYGYLLLSQMDQLRGWGSVAELDQNKEKRWEIEDVRYPVDAQILGPDRVLITEYLGKRVTERDFKGKILWEYSIKMPIAAQRLPNGQTFIASKKQLLVVDREGKEVFTYFHQGLSIAAAARMRDGSMMLVAGTQFFKLDGTGREVRSFDVGQVYTMGGQIDVLPGERVLVPEYYNNRVAEYDTDGKVRWEVAVPTPTSATRLPNGLTLVVSMGSQRVSAFDRDGKEAWYLDVPGRPWRARMR